MAHIVMECPAGVETYNEAQWQRAVVDAAGRHGWLHIHIRDARYNPPGIPDLFLFREERYMLLELKTLRGKLGAAQIRFAEEAAWRGVGVSLVRNTREDWDWLQEVLR